MSKINVLEVRVLEHCNYKCIACGAFSNIAKAEVYDLKEFENDLIRIKQIFGGVNTFRIYGGEPLILKNLSDYILIARNIFNDAIIEIVTNGLLLRKKDDTFYNLLKNYCIRIVLSDYGDNRQIIDEGISILKEKDVELEIVPIKHFYVMQDFSQESDPEINRKMCVVNIATYLHHGRIYSCPYPFSYKHYDKIYNTNYNMPEVGIDIYDTTQTATQILRKLDKSNDFCKYCKDKPSYVERKQGNAGEYDWFNADENPHLLKNYTWYDFLKEVNKLVYNAILFENGNYEYKILREEDLKNYKKIFIWIEDYYGENVLNQVFIPSFKTLHLDYEIMHFKEGIHEEDILKFDSKNNNNAIIIFCENTKTKIKILKLFKHLVNSY